MKYQLSRQKGMSVINFLLVFIGVGFVGVIGLKLLPIYLEHYKIQATLNNLKTVSDITDQTPDQITAMLQKRWDINGISRIKAAESVFVEKHLGQINVQVTYEAEEHLFANVSAVVKFDDTVEIGEQN
jgi:hypothetical protein